MQRSRSQVLFSFLPQAVFRHEDRLFGQVATVDGVRQSRLNESVVFEEISRYLQLWDDNARHDLPLPTADRRREYAILTPETVRWEVYPLVFECTRRNCGRVRSFREARDVAKSPRCSHCGGGMRQLGFYNAHNCGRTQPLYIAKCSMHGYDHITFENTGSFTTATWRCRGQGCNNAVVRQTNQSPCSCGRYPGRDLVVRMRAHTLDDNRAYTPHSIDLVNIDSSVFQDYQKHPARDQIALAHYLGLVNSLRDGITQANATSGGTRMSAAEWELKASSYRMMGLGEADIAVLRATYGPAESGLASVDVSAAVLDVVAPQRRVYERAAVYDLSEVRRLTLADQRSSAAARNDPGVVEVLDKAQTLASEMGLSEVAVSWEFPIAKVVFGYSRESPTPGEADLRGFRHQAHHEGKHPVYAVETETEAVLVTLDAVGVCEFLTHRGELASAPGQRCGRETAAAGGLRGRGIGPASGRNGDCTGAHVEPPNAARPRRRPGRLLRVEPGRVAGTRDADVRGVCKLAERVHPGSAVDAAQLAGGGVAVRRGVTLGALRERPAVLPGLPSRV